MTLLIHPGFHKTGTTFLQEKVFQHSENYYTVLSHNEVDELLVAPHDVIFDAEKVSSFVTGRLVKKPSLAVPVLSSEILSGNPLLGSKDSFHLARRLFAALPEGKILFTVRRQQDALLSLYLQYIKRGGRLHYRDFFEFYTEPGYSWFRVHVVEYCSLVNLYADLYGIENVLVLPQEWLKYDIRLFLSTLDKYVTPPHSTRALDDVSIGTSPPASGIYLMRIGNLFRRTPLNPNAITSLSFVGDRLHSVAIRQKLGQQRAKEKMQRYIRKRFSGQFRESNKRLQAYTPADLAALGYEI